MESNISPKLLRKNLRRAISPSTPSRMEVNWASNPPRRGWDKAKETAAATAVNKEKKVI